MHKIYALVLSSFMSAISFYAFQLVFFVLLIVITVILSLILVRETSIYQVYNSNIFILIILNHSILAHINTRLLLYHIMHCII